MDSVSKAQRPKSFTSFSHWSAHNKHPDWNKVPCHVYGHIFTFEWQTAYGGILMYWPLYFLSVFIVSILEFLFSFMWHFMFLFVGVKIVYKGNSLILNWAKLILAIVFNRILLVFHPKMTDTTLKDANKLCVSLLHHSCHTLISDWQKQMAGC